MTVMTAKAKTRTRKLLTVEGLPLIREDIHGILVEYYPLGKHVVVQPGVCGGRPTLWNTRIDARHILGALRRGDSPELIADDYNIPVEAVHEAVALADVYDYERSYA